MPGQLIQRCYEKLMKYRESNQIQQGTARKKQKCYHIMQRHTQMQSSAINQAIWSHGQYWHFCGAIINIHNDRNPYKAVK